MQSLPFRAESGEKSAFRKTALEPVLSGVRGDRGRVLPGKARMAVPILSGQRAELFRRKVSQRIRADHLRDLRYGVVAGDQVLLRIDIGAVIAGMQKRGRRDPHMDFLRSGLPQEGDDPPAGGSADNGIVDQHHPFSADHIPDRGQFDPDLIQPVIRRDEGSSDIFVFDQADFVRNAGGTAESQRGVQAGIRNADDDIRFGRMRFGQAFPGADAGRVDGRSVQNGIRPGR